MNFYQLYMCSTDNNKKQIHKDCNTFHFASKSLTGIFPIFFKRRAIELTFGPAVANSLIYTKNSIFILRLKKKNK